MLLIRCRGFVNGPRWIGWTSASASAALACTLTVLCRSHCRPLCFAHAESCCLLRQLISLVDAEDDDYPITYQLNAVPNSKLMHLHIPPPLDQHHWIKLYVGQRLWVAETVIYSYCWKNYFADYQQVWFIQIIVHLMLLRQQLASFLPLKMHQPDHTSVHPHLPSYCFLTRF